MRYQATTRGCHHYVLPSPQGSRISTRRQSHVGNHTSAITRRQSHVGNRLSGYFSFSPAYPLVGIPFGLFFVKTDSAFQLMLTCKPKSL